MKKYFYHGFEYDTDEELQSYLTVPEYLDFKYGKQKDDWKRETWIDADEDDNDSEHDYEDKQCPLSVLTYDLRGAEGMTRKEFAEKLGISLSKLSRIERGQSNTSKRIQMKIQNFYDEQYPLY